jgi:SAM-dependent methyltransferase
MDLATHYATGPAEDDRLTRTAPGGLRARELLRRHLDAADATYDVVLLFSPLDHLAAGGGRARALAEARPVLHPGGLLAVAEISRYLSLPETGAAGTFSPGHAGFVPTHWHTATELHDEVAAASFTETAVFGVEGPSWPALDAAGLSRFGELVEPALRSARIVERDPHLVDASAHLLAFGRRPA